MGAVPGGVSIMVKWLTFSYSYIRKKDQAQQSNIVEQTPAVLDTTVHHLFIRPGLIT